MSYFSPSRTEPNVSGDAPAHQISYAVNLAVFSLGDDWDSPRLAPALDTLTADTGDASANTKRRTGGGFSTSRSNKPHL